MALKPLPPREHPPANSGIPVDIWREMEIKRHAEDVAHHAANPEAWGANMAPRHDAATQKVFDAVNADNAAQEAQVQEQATEQIAEIDAEIEARKPAEEAPKRGPGRPRQFTRTD